MIKEITIPAVVFVICTSVGLAFQLPESAQDKFVCTVHCEADKDMHEAGTDLPAPFEGKYYRLVDATGTTTISDGDAVLVVLDSTDVLAAWEEDSYAYFAGGTSYYYNANGEIINTTLYTWNEPDSSVTLIIEGDSSHKIFYDSVPGGMAFITPDTSVEISQSSGIYYTYTFENYSEIYEEIPDPTPVSFPGRRLNNGLKVRSVSGGLAFTWERLEGDATLAVFDVGGQAVSATQKIRPDQRQAFFQLPGGRVYIYRLTDGAGVLTADSFYLPEIE